MTRRANVAVLFCDLVGSTALLSALGDVANDELRRDVFAVLRRPVLELGGHEVKSQGDGLMVAFEAPADAVACAVAMQEGLARLAARDRSVVLALRVGVAAGEATYEEDDWFGTPVVEAARLCGVARSGQVLVTEAVAEVVAMSVDLVDEGARELKGLPEARPTWSVPWRIAEAGGPLPVPPALQVSAGRPLLGRSEADAVLEAAWGSVRAGGVRTVVVTGEAGMGKSRLTAEVAGRAHADGAAVLLGRAVPGGDGREVFGEALRWWVVGSPPEVVRRACDGLRPTLDGLLPSLVTRLGPVIGPASSPPGADARPPTRPGRPITADGADGGRSTTSERSAPPVVPIGPGAGGAAEDLRTAVLGLIGRLSASAPVVLVVEDAHLLGPDGVELVVDLALGAAATRLLLVIVARDDGGARRSGSLAALTAKLDGAVEVSTVSLVALDDAAAAGILGLDDADAVALANAEADGNPARLMAIARQLSPSVVAAGPSDDSGPHGGGSPSTPSSAVDRVRAAIARSAPYKGLSAFGADDRDLLFGRDVLVQAVIERLATHRLVAVVGPSGSGKSSVVHAGVLPSLADGALAGSAGWSVAVLAPGEDPVGALDVALASASGAAAGPTGDPVRLVVVDQAEELFTLCADEGRRRAAIDRLLDLAGDAAGSRVLLTLRADFFGRAAESPPLAAMLEGGTVLAPPLTEPELRAAVEGPAAVAGLRLEPGLVDVVVADAVERPGALPLVSHAMYETWRRRRGRTLTLDDLREVGGVDGAVARTADDVYVRSFDGEAQLLARSLLVRLTEPGEGTEDTRRRVSRSELAGVGGARLDEVVETLVAARLLTVDEDHVEVAHEAVIRAWPRLRGWLDEDRDAVRVHRRLTRAAAEWDEAGRPSSELYRGARLDATLEWLAGHPGEASTVESELIEASEGLRRSEEAAAEARVMAQRRANRRLRGLLVAAGVALVVALVAAVLAVRSANEAEDLALTADARAAAAQSRSLAGQDAVLGRILAAEAHALRDLPETRAALADVLGADGRSVRVIETGTAYQLAIAPDGSLVVATSESVRRWDPVSGEAVGEPTSIEPGEPSLSADASAVLTANGIEATVTDLAQGRPPWSMPAEGAVYRSLSSDGERALRSVDDSWEVVGADGTVLWSMSSAADEVVDAVVLSATGDRVALARSVRVAGGGPGEAVDPPVTTAVVEVIEVPGGRVVASTAVARSPAGMAFAPDGSALAVALPAPPSSAGSAGSFGSGDVIASPGSAEVLVLDGDDLAPVGPVLPGSWLGWAGDRPATIAPPRDGSTADGAVVVWTQDLRRAAEVPLPPVVGVPTWIGGAGDVVVTGAAGAARVAVWDLSRPPGLVGDPFGQQGLSDVHLTADGAYVVATDRSGEGPTSLASAGPRTVVVEIATGAVVAETPGSLTGVTPDGRALVDGRWRRIPDLSAASSDGDLGGPNPLGFGVLSPDGRLLAARTSAPYIDLVDLTTGDGGSDRVRFGEPSFGVTSSTDALVAGASFSGDGSRLAVWFTDLRAAVVVDVATREVVGPPIEQTAGVTSLALDATGGRVAVGAADGTVSVRAVATGEQRWLPMVGPTDAVIGLRWLTPTDGNPPVVVSVGAAGEVVLHEPDSGTTLGRPLPVRVVPGAGVDGLGVSVVGGAARLVLATSGGLVEANVVVSSWPDQACALAGRSFDAEEWAQYFPGRPARTTCGP